MITVWNNSANKCTECPYFSYRSCNYDNSIVFDYAEEKTIHSNCQFLKEIDELKEINHNRYSHLKEIFINDKKLVQIKNIEITIDLK